MITAAARTTWTIATQAGHAHAGDPDVLLTVQELLRLKAGYLS